WRPRQVGMKYSAHSSTATRTITPPLSTGPSIESTVSEPAGAEPLRGSRVASNAPDPSGCRDSGHFRHRARLWRHPSLNPAVQHAAWHVLAGESECMVVAPVTVDVDEASTQPLIAEAELAHHAQAGAVLRTDTDLHAVQAELLEG